jgi:hypothetical protein
MLDVTFVLQTLIETVARIVLSPLALVIVAPYWWVACRVQGRWAGLPWLCITLPFQLIYWAVHYAPYVPLVVPSRRMVALLFIATAGIWMFARRRVIAPWKWSVLGLLPLLGPLFAITRLGAMPITFPAKLSPKAFTLAAGVGYVALLLGGIVSFGEGRVSAVPAPDERARLVATATRLMDLNITFQWQRLLGPFVIQSHHIYKTPDERSTAMTIRWSRDSTKVLISGPNFDVVERERPRGGRLYLLYETGSTR